MDRSARTKLERAGSHLLLSNPFFGTLLLRLRAEESPKVESVTSDGRTLRYNPEFVHGLTDQETQGVLAATVGHLAMLHHLRRDERDKSKWAQATDYALHPILEDAGITLPKAQEFDRHLANSFRGKHAEDIYSILPEDPKGGGGGNGGGDGTPDPNGCGAAEDATGEDGEELSAAERSQQEAEWQVAVVQAAQAAKAAGQLPGELKRLLDMHKEASVDWREVLRRFLTSVSKSDQKWTPPNRRHIHAGIYLPSYRPDQLGPIAVVIDTSGSIWGDPELLEQFQSELNAALEEARPEKAHVVYWDTDFRGQEEFTPDDYPVKLEVQGGGGTVFDGVWNRLEAEGIEPVAAIFLTDLEVMRLPPEPPFPVLWAVHGGRESAMNGDIHGEVMAVRKLK
jgi:predicted metal-dependent peptidase